MNTSSGDQFVRTCVPNNVEMEVGGGGGGGGSKEMLNGC